LYSLKLFKSSSFSVSLVRLREYIFFCTLQSGGRNSQELVDNLTQAVGTGLTHIG